MTLLQGTKVHVLLTLDYIPYMYCFSPDELMNLVEKRIGCEIFLDKLSEVSKHEAYNRALKHPQLPR